MHLTTNPLSAPTRERNLSIDVVKIIAMFGVICLHTTRGFMSSQGTAYSLASFLYKSAVISIPLFFVVSGYLQLGRDITWKYVIKKIWHIVRYMLIFIVSLWLLLCTLGKTPMTTEYFIKALYEPLLVKGPFFVFWFFGAMAFLYLLLPIVNVLHSHKKTFLGVTIGLCVIQNAIFSHLLTGGGTSTLMLYSECTTGFHIL